MDKNKMFQIYYEGKNYEIEKSKVNFSYGYGIVKKIISNMSRSWGKLELIGVVDSEFNTVIAFEAYYHDIQLFPEGNVILQERYSGGDGEQAYSGLKYYHGRITEKGHFSKLDKISEYQKINETTLKMRNNNAKFILYDLKEARIISPGFSEIDDFLYLDDNSNKRIAKSTLKLSCMDGTDNDCYVICYIDEAGKIVSAIWNSFDNQFMAADNIDFDFDAYVEGLKTTLLEEGKIKKETVNKLSRTII